MGESQLKIRYSAEAQAVLLSLVSNMKAYFFQEGSGDAICNCLEMLGSWVL